VFASESGSISSQPPIAGPNVAREMQLCSHGAGPDGPPAKHTANSLGVSIMRTTINRVIAVASLAILPASIAAAQVNVSPAPGGGIQVQAPGANVVTPPGAGAAIRDNALNRQENRIEHREDRQLNRAAANENWRMVNHQNRWWYYHPNNSWSYYQGNRWVPFRSPNTQYSATQPAPDQPGRYQSGFRGPAPNGTVAPNASVAPNGTLQPTPNLAAPGAVGGAINNPAPALNPAPAAGK
jgi:hypothetical protein